MTAVDIMKEINGQVMSTEKIDTKGCYGSIIYEPADVECQTCQFKDGCELLVEETRDMQMQEIDTQLQMVKKAMLDEAPLAEEEPLDGNVEELTNLMVKGLSKKFRPIFKNLFAELIMLKHTDYNDIAAKVKHAVRKTKYNPSYLMRQKIMPALVDQNLISWGGQKADVIIWL